MRINEEFKSEVEFIRAADVSVPSATDRRAGGGSWFFDGIAAGLLVASVLFTNLDASKSSVVKTAAGNETSGPPHSSQSGRGSLLDVVAGLSDPNYRGVSPETRELAKAVAARIAKAAPLDQQTAAATASAFISIAG